LLYRRRIALNPSPTQLPVVRTREPTVGPEHAVRVGSTLDRLREAVAVDAGGDDGLLVPPPTGLVHDEAACQPLLMAAN
jgi:hypothetical protein